MAKKDAFTLIEVMVATLIITLLIAAVYKIKGDATHRLETIKKTEKTLQYNSLLIGNTQKYGFESDSVSLYNLVDGFNNLENDLRRELKSIKINISYDKIDSMELPSGSVLEVGKTKIHSKLFDSSLLRVRFE